MRAAKVQIGGCYWARVSGAYVQVAVLARGPGQSADNDRWVGWIVARVDNGRILGRTLGHRSLKANQPPKHGPRGNPFPSGGYK